VLEALLGQIFLVTLVARLVALYTAEAGTGAQFVRRRRAELEAQGTGARGDENPKDESRTPPDVAADER
jgi:hypothetical protein